MCSYGGSQSSQKFTKTMFQKGQTVSLICCFAYISKQGAKALLIPFNVYVLKHDMNIYNNQILFHLSSLLLTLYLLNSLNGFAQL